MEEKKKHIEIHIEMDENEQIAPEFKDKQRQRRRSYELLSCWCGIHRQYHSR